jgi:dihydrofolate synthase/folylpolyglutamate synthase
MPKDRNTVSLVRTYPETLKWLMEQLPIFQRVGPAAYRQGMEGIQTLCRFLDHPQRRMGKVIHVAGTNGKGSVSHMLAAMLQTMGYRTGLFTSPHLRDFRERIRVNGQPIAEDCVVHWVAHLRQCSQYQNPSFFEFTTAMAFAYFAESDLDFTVIETGLGGRLDSTNVVEPILSLITHIDWDHMNLLGHTLPLIAAEKAGIIKRGVPVILGRTQSEEIQQVFARKAHEYRCLLYNADQCYQLTRNPKEGETAWQVTRSGKALSQTLHCDLLGDYQAENIGQALMAVEILQQCGEEMDLERCMMGLKNVMDLTGLRGRWQLWGTRPLRVADVAHNCEGIVAVLNQAAASLENLSLQIQGCRPRLHIVLGMVNDKDHDAVLSLMPDHATYYFCAPHIPRALPASELAVKARANGLKGAVWPSVDLAWRAAVQAAGEYGMVLATGSFFVVAEITHNGHH